MFNGATKALLFITKYRSTDLLQYLPDITQINDWYASCHVIHSQLSPTRSPRQTAAHNVAAVRIGSFNFSLESRSSTETSIFIFVESCLGFQQFCSAAWATSRVTLCFLKNVRVYLRANSRNAYIWDQQIIHFLCKSCTFLDTGILKIVSSWIFW